LGADGWMIPACWYRDKVRAMSGGANHPRWGFGRPAALI
jgi:hypothetical protein